MTELKCPIHNIPLEKDFGYDGDYSCSKCGSNIMFGSEELWQALIDAKKKLDDAVDALREICAGVPSDKWVFDTANKAINELTKKEEKNDRL